MASPRTDSSDCRRRWQPRLLGGAVLAILVSGGCSVGEAPRPDGSAFVPGQAHRVLRSSVEQVWPRLLGAVADEGLTVANTDARHHVIACAPLRRAGPPAVLLREVKEIADLATARGRLRLISDYIVTYTLFLEDVAGDTALKVTAGIEATDRSQVIAIAPGVVQRIPLQLPLRSRGVAERRLLTRLAASLFAADEMLYLMGELGLD